jgi:hypothetical protein
MDLLEKSVLMTNSYAEQLRVASFADILLSSGIKDEVSFWRM